MTEENGTTYKWMEGCYAEISGACYSGVFLTLDNGESAFAYGFTALRPGSRVICTVRRQARGEVRKLVTIDSVLSYGPAAA